MLLPSIPSILLLTTTVLAIPQPQPQTSSSPSSGTACNNSPNLCSQPYNQVTYLGAHNSAFLRDASTDHTISGNHFYNATLALDAGLRLLQAQVHDVSGVMHLCHSSCSLLDAGPLEDWLRKIADWIESNQRDVVTILLVNAADKEAPDFAKVWQSSGLSKFGYAPPSSANGPLSQWPTLGDMITSGKRLVSFVTRINASPAAPYLLPEFSYVFETPFEVTDITGFNCTVDRPNKAGTSGTTAKAAGWLSLINHFKYQSVLGTLNFPDVDSIATVNDAGSSTAGNFGKQVDECKTQWGAKPNFVLVDFWSEGDPLKKVDELNGVTAPVGRSRKNVKELGPQGAKGIAAGPLRPGDLGHAALIAFIGWAMFLF